MGDFLEWLRSTEIYKDDKLWQLFCSIIPSIEVVVGWAVAFFQWRSRSKLDKENKIQIIELEAKFENQLREKDSTIKKLEKSSEKYKMQLEAYKSKYGKLKIRRW